MLENLGAIDTAATNLNGAIGKGFSMDPAGVQQLLTFVKGMQTAVRKVIGQNYYLSLQPKLGSTPAANVYKPYLPTVATDPTQGFIPVLQKVQQQLNQAATDIQGSLTAYEENEQNTTGSLVNIHPVEMA